MSFVLDLLLLAVSPGPAMAGWRCYRLSEAGRFVTARAPGREVRAADDDLAWEACRRELDAGGRIVVLADAAMEEQANALLTRLQIGVRVHRATLGSAYAHPVVAEDQVTNGLDEIVGNGFVRLTVSGSAIALTRDRQGFVACAADQGPLTDCVRPGCDVIVIGDAALADQEALVRLLERRHVAEPRGKVVRFLHNLADPDGVLQDEAEGMKRRCRRLLRPDEAFEECVQSLMDRRREDPASLTSLFLIPSTSVVHLEP